MGRIGVETHVDGGGEGAKQTVEMIVVLEGFVKRVGEDASVLVRRDGEPVKLVGVVGRDEAQQGGVDDGEQRGVGADSKGQSDHRDGGEGLVLAEGSKGEAQVVEDAQHVGLSIPPGPGRKQKLGRAALPEPRPGGSGCWGTRQPLPPGRGSGGCRPAESRRVSSRSARICCAPGRKAARQGRAPRTRRLM